jgi:predicted transcriptional regulator
VSLKDNLREPLGGMSTSFSTSLFGLASSLVIGFLDLQAGHAQNRFYNELEEWLATLTHHAIGNVIEGETTVPSYVQALLEQTADELERMQRAVVGIERTRRDGAQQLDELVSQFERFNDLLDRDIRERQASAVVQDELKVALRQIASHSRHESGLSDDLRAEFRLLSRTISAALDAQQVRA